MLRNINQSTDLAGCPSLVNVGSQGIGTTQADCTGGRKPLEQWLKNTVMQQTSVNIL
jgi:hypothetical protein